MASGGKTGKYLRHWNNSDSLEPSDLCQLYEANRVSLKSGRSWRAYMTIYLVFIAFLALFLFGILVGFYVRESQKVSNACGTEQRRTDGLDSEKLQSVHQNIMYYLSSKSIESYERKLKEFHSEESSAEFIAKEFKKFGLERVKIEEHSIVVTYPDPARPNRLEVLDDKNSTVYNITNVENRDEAKRSKQNEEELTPLMPSISSGAVEGKLVYANFGENIDYLHLRSMNVTVNNSVLLVRHGHISYSTKMKIAQKYGASGLLVYCHPVECPVRSKYTTPANYLPDEELFYPAIPGQILSIDAASNLLRYIPRNSIPTSWLASIEKLSSVAANSSTSIPDVKVRLTANAQRSSRKIQNIVATLPGGTEQDRNVILGATRSAGSLSSPGTAILLEIARSLSYIRKFEGWIPRRGIEIRSWGGGSLDKAGVTSHIANNKDKLGESVVSYIDLDGPSSQVAAWKIYTSPGLGNLVRKAARMVPDPFNGDISLGENWPSITANDLWNGNSSVNIYNTVNMNSFPILAAREISTVQMPINYSTNHTKGGTEKNVLSQARIVSLILSSLVDREILPISTRLFSDFVKKAFKEVLKLQQYWSKQITDNLLSSIEELRECSETWQSLCQNLPECPSELKIRQINNILVGLDRHFIKTLPFYRSNYLLSHGSGEETVTVLKTAIEEYKYSNSTETLDQTILLLLTSLQNFSSSVCKLKQILR